MPNPPPNIAPMTPPKRAFALSKPQPRGQRIALYGTGGIGKTSLAALAPGRKAFFDLDESASVLGLNIEIVVGVETWKDLREAIASPVASNADIIVIDSVTRAEELAVAHTLATVPHEKGYPIRRIEDYGFGKGYQHVFDTFLPLLSDLDAHARAGRHVILIMHDCMSSVPNPQGDDYIRYEPRLQNPSSGKGSIRLRLKEWVDHLFFIGFDIDVKDNKAKGSGTRTIYPVEMPHCMAKSRALREPLEYVDGSDELWGLLNIGG